MEVKIKLYDEGTKLIALYNGKFVECTIASKAVVYINGGEVEDVYYDTDIPDPKYTTLTERICASHLFETKDEAIAFVGLDKI